MDVRLFGPPLRSSAHLLRAATSVLLLLLAGFAVVGLGGCGRVDSTEVMMDQLVQMEDQDYADREISARRVEEIQVEIRRYRKEVERTVDAAGQLGIYYKMLAVEYMRGGMFGTAFEALQQAIAIHPENPILFYYAGVCTARMSAAQVIEEQRAQWLERSEKMYRRAVTLDPEYADALYALSVLYVFELDQPEQAESLLESLLAVESKDIDGRFLLARVYYLRGGLEEAIEVYREIESLSNVELIRREARKGIEQIEEQLYGAQ